MTKENPTICPHIGERDLHSCPYQVDVEGNNDPEYCNCCEDCEKNCAEDI